MRRLTFGIALAYALSGIGFAPLAHADAKKDLSALRACLSEKADDEKACIDVVAGPCMEQPDGQTTVGMSECVDAEQGAWDTILNERYGAAMAYANERDAEMKESLATGSATSVAGSLRTAQRAWVAYRDAECERLWAEYQDGTIRMNVLSGCLRDLTAERTVALAPDEG